MGLATNKGCRSKFFDCKRICSCLQKIEVQCYNALLLIAIGSRSTVHIFLTDEQAGGVVEET
jgi:hypothetical protein